MPKEGFKGVAALGRGVQRLLYTPIDGLEAFAFQISVRLAEMPAAEEPAVSRKWTWVRSLENQVPSIGCNQELLFDGETSPKQKHDVLADLRKSLNDGVGELLPADSRMARRHVRPNRERCVQK